MSIDPSRPDFSLEEYLAHHKAVLDQGMAGLKEMSQACAVIYHQLVADGVPGEFASAIAGNWLVGMIAMNRDDVDDS